MPAAKKKVDWRQARKQEETGGGRVLLERGNRNSEGNEGTFTDLTPLEGAARRQAILQQMEANRRMYLTMHGFGGPESPLKTRLKGLFGGRR